MPRRARGDPGAVVSAPDSLRERLRSLPLGQLLHACAGLRGSSRQNAEEFATVMALRATARRALGMLVDGILAVARAGDGRTTNWRGCFFGNTALELGSSDPDVVARLKIGVDTLRSLFEAALSRPAAGASRLSDVIVRQRALQCVANIQGMLVLAKSGLSDAEIKVMRDAMIASAIKQEK